MKRLLGYLLISIFVTSLDVVLLVFLVEFMSMHYLNAATLSYTTAVLTKFALNKWTVFSKAEGEWSRQLMRFITVSVSGLALTYVLLYIGVELLSYPYVLVKIGCVGVVFILTFMLHSVFSFKSKTLLVVKNREQS